MKSKNSIKTIFIIILITNLIFVGGSMYLVFSLQDIQKELVTLEQTQEDKETKAENFFKLKNLIEETKNERAQLDTYFIESETGTVELLEKIEEISDILNVPITININTETASFDNVSGDVLRLSIETAGTFQEMNQLLILFENITHKIVIDGVSLRRASAVASSESAPMWNMSLVLRVISFVK